MRRKSQGRSDRRRKDAEFQQLPWRSVVNPYPPLEFLSADQIEAIHDASLQILEELGVEFLSTRALELLKGAGAEVDLETQMVRFDRGLVMETVAKAPSSFTLTPRKPRGVCAAMPTTKIDSNDEVFTAKQVAKISGGRSG